MDWTLIYDEDLALTDASEVAISDELESAYLLYSASANLTSTRIGTFLHWEAMGVPGDAVMARYPAMKGKNLLAIAGGLEPLYRLSFVPAPTRSAILSFTLRIWRPTMPLFTRSTGGSSALPVSTTAAATAVPAATSTTTILAANEDRKGASICNASTATLYLELGSTVSATDFAVALGAGDYFEVPYNYTGAIAGLWTAANGNAMVREFT
jgi:hypothetical protein